MSNNDDLRCRFNLIDSGTKLIPRSCELCGIFAACRYGHQDPSDGVQAAIEARDAPVTTSAENELHEATASLAIKAWLLSQAMQRKFLMGSEIPPTGAELEEASRRVSRAMKNVADEVNARRDSIHRGARRTDHRFKL